MTEELFNVEWTTGNLSQKGVTTIAHFLGLFATVVISIVGFGIVWATILKNAMHGLYAVAPKFWDRVDEVKKAGIRNGEAGGKLANGNNEVMKLLGSVSSVLLSLLPNVKAMTDFDGELLDAKAYFMKAIPMMCVNIFVGVFIFFGYPAQVAQKFSDFGTGLFNVVLTNVDPGAWVEAVPEKLAMLKFSTDGSMNSVDRRVNKISKKVASVYLGAVDDITKEMRPQVALQLEKWVLDNINDAAEYCDDDKYDLDVTATVYMTGGMPDVSRVHNQVVDGIATFAYVKQMDEFETGTAKDISSWYIRYDLKFTPKASTGSKLNADVVMTVESSRFVVDTSNGRVTIKMSDNVGVGYSINTISSARGTAITSNNEEYEVSISLVGDSVVIKPKSSKNKIDDIVSVQSIQGVSYRYGNSTNKIIEIKVGGNGITFTTNEGKSWSYGEDPAGKGSTSSTADVEEKNDSSVNKESDEEL